MVLSQNSQNVSTKCRLITIQLKSCLLTSQHRIMIQKFFMMKKGGTHVLITQARVL